MKNNSHFVYMAIGLLWLAGFLMVLFNVYTATNCFALACGVVVVTGLISSDKAGRGRR